MKKTWFKGLSLSFACLLGVGGLIGAIHSSKSNDVKVVKAATEVLWKTFNFSDTFLSSIEEANAVDGFWITWSIEGTGNTAAMQDGALHMHVVEPGGRNVFDLRYRIPTDVEICKIEVDAIPGLDGNGVGGRNQNFSIQGNLDGAYADRQYIQRSGSSSATTKSTFTFTPKEADGPNILNQISLKLGTETKNRNTQYTFDTYFWEMRFYKAVYSQPVTITAGTGVQSVYLSENSTATSGSASGTNYDIGKTVYGFATIQTGYSAPSGWAKVSGSTYRVGSKTVGESGADFGTVNATLDTYSIQYTLNGGSVSGNPTSYNVNSNAFTLKNPTKTGYTFDGWSGTGISGKSTSVTVNKGSTGNRSYTANWTANTYTVKYNGNKPANAPGSVSNIPANATWTYDSNASLGNAPSLIGYVFDGWYKENTCTTKVGNAGQQLTKPNLTATKGATVNLYAKWILDPAIQAVIDNINNIGTVEYPDSRAAINTARDGYDALSSDYQALVNNYGTLTADEEAYATLRTNAINDAKDKIDNIGIVSYPESKEAIVAAENAYDALYSGDRSEVTNYETLTDARSEFDTLRQQAIDEVIAAIDAIGDVTYPSSKSDIEHAEELYSNLHNDDKNSTIITNQDVLFGDRTSYNNQRDAAVAQVITNISDIQKPFNLETYDNEIATARNSYEALDEDEKNTTWVTNYQKLVDAESASPVVKEILAIDASIEPQDYIDSVVAAREHYDSLSEDQKGFVPDSVLKVLIDNEAAYTVVGLVMNLNPITYNGGINDSLAAIENAEAAYATLTPDQKALVNECNYDDLVHARTTYDNVDNSVKLIEAIGTVAHTDDSKGKIDAARSAYDALTEEERALVNGYKETYKTLDDAEHVYQAMVYIDDIGNIAYDTDPEGRIAQAREYYDSLSEDQKQQVGDVYLNVLVKAEAETAHITKVNTIWLIIGLVLSFLILVGAFFFIFFLFKRRKDDDDDDDENKNEKSSSKKEPVKAMSVGGGFLFIILTSHYIDAPWILLYIFAPIAFLAIVACVVLYILKRKGKISPAKKRTVEKSTVQDLPSPQSESEEEVETVTDEKGNVFQIRYIKSFTAKLIQSPEETKKYYEKLKNEVLSYKNTNSRISWHHDAVNSGRAYVLKFAIRGKTLCVYLPLDPEKQEEKYKVEKVESKRFEDVPCMYRIKNDRRCEYAKDLITKVCESMGLEKGKEQNEVYSNLPYEANKPLVARGLIKEQKVAVSKQAEPVVLETKVNADGDEVVLTKDASGNIFEIRYIKSFTAKLSQSEKEVKDYYTVLKNYILSYKDTHSRVSWHYDAINVGRDYVLKFAIRGKTLCVYYALDASKLDEKYKVEEAKGKKYEEVPVLYRIKNDRRCEYAKELIDLLMKQKGLEQGENPSEDYHIKKESTKALLKKGLIKELKTAVKNPVPHLVASVSVDEVDKMMSDEDAEVLIEEDNSSKAHKGKKAIVNIDELEANFNDGDKITLEVLQEKGLVAKDVGRVKLLARGRLDKKLHVDLQEYSLQAVKMILLVGGKVQKAK